MPVKNISLTTDYDVEAAEIQRRRKMAELMQQQGMQPSEGTQMVGGWAIPQSPLHGLAKIVQSYAGARGQTEADARTKALAERIRGDRSADWSTLAQGMAGKPEEVMPENVAGPPQPAQPAGRINPALISQLRTPEAQAAAMQMMQKQMEPRQIGSGGLLNPDGSITPPVFRPEKPQKQERWSDPYQLGGATVQKNLDTGQVRTAVTRPARTTINMPKPEKVPLGYRLTPDGNLMAIPGGPADAKAGDAALKKDRALQRGEKRADTVIAKVDEALNKTGFWTTGLIGDIRSTLPGRLTGSGAYDLEKTIDTIKANIGFQELEDMRAASPTGGALGQIAVRELDFLQAALSSLEQGQSTDQLVKNLTAVKTHFSNWKRAIQEASQESPQGQRNVIVPPGTRMPGNQADPLDLR